MGLLFQCIHIKKEYEERTILSDVHFDVALGDRVGIVGPNGAGKTTLVQIISDIIMADGGDIIWHEKEARIGYLHQSTYYAQEDFHTLFSGTQDEISDFYKTTKSLGIHQINPQDADRLSHLSGGERTKLALAGIWAKAPDLLILDEPTNHMDYEGTQWLVSQLKRYKGTLLLISHDRYFLDRCVDKILEIEEGKSTVYQGNYTAYRNEKKRRCEEQQHQYKEQEKVKAHIQTEISRLKGWSEKAHKESTHHEGFKEHYRVKAKKKDKQVKSRIKRLEKMSSTGVEKPNEAFQVKFDHYHYEDSGSDIILRAEEIKKSFKEAKLFAQSSFYIKRGERVAKFGSNGCCKTTLIKAILGELSLDEGQLSLSRSVKPAYLSQDVFDLNDEQSLLDTFDFGGYSERGVLQTLLTNLGFSKVMIHKKVGTLSLGERTRLKIAHMIMQDNNVLILDEPTNHLDLVSREMLEEVLES